MMKQVFGKLLSAALALPLLASCLGDETPYQAGFTFLKPYTAVTAVYANTDADSIVMYSYGDWNLEVQRNDDSFCSLNLTGGKANYLYAVPVNFAQNTTGKSRMALFHVYDIEHSGEASAQFGYLQFATRGDGSMGNAPVVKRVTGSDGSGIQLTYDAKVRPTSLRATKDGQVVHSLTISYNDYDSIMTVGYGSSSMSGRYNNGYQPEMLISEADTMAYFAQRASYGITLSASTAFNVEFRRAAGNYQAFAYLLNGQSLMPDSVHNADSLRYYHSLYNGTKILHKWKLTYGNGSNLTQTVDVNQLIYGVEEMNPFLFLSLFRWARGEDNDDVTISSVTRNSDSSIRELTVTGPQGAVTYTFDY